MKILFCGLGSIGQRHLRNTLRLLGDEAEILAYRKRNSSPVLKSDMTIATGKLLKETYPIAEYFDLTEALDQKPDVVFITNPNSEHMAVALAAARKGCHIFIEKPISHNLDGVDELLKLVSDQHLKVFVAYQFRFHPAFRKIKAILEAGTIGRIISAHVVNAEYIPHWHPYENYETTHPIWKNMGGGCHNIQTHELDIALWLFGNPISVYATGGKLSDLAGDAPDTVDVLINFQQGVHAYPVHIHLDYLQWPHQRYCEIVGTKGKITFDYYKNELWIYNTERQAKEMISYDQFERNDMFLAELENFFGAVTGKNEIAIDLTEGIRSLHLSHSIETSLLNNQVVSYAP